MYEFVYVNVYACVCAVACVLDWVYQCLVGTMSESVCVRASMYGHRCTVYKWM